MVVGVLIIYLSWFYSHDNDFCGRKADESIIWKRTVSLCPGLVLVGLDNATKYNCVDCTAQLLGTPFP